MEFSFDSFLKPLVRKMLRPVISLLISNSVSYRMLCQVLKEIYVDVAASEYGKAGRPTNISRISLLTGVNRKDVKRLRDAVDKSSEPGAVTPHSQSGPLGRVLSAWYLDPVFAPDGVPVAISVEKEFADLCKRYGGDITRTAILNELLRVKAVEHVPDNKIIAISRYYLPEQTDEEALSRSCDVYRDLGNTLLHNLYRDDSSKSRFEGRASSPEVPVQYVEDFHNFVEQRGQQFLEDIDERLSGYESSAQSHHQTVRLGMGMYWIENDQESVNEH